MRTSAMTGVVGGMILSVAVSGCCLGLHPPRPRVNRAGPEVRLPDRWGGYVPDEFAPYLAKVKPALDKNPLPADQPYSVVEIERTPVRSVHVAQVRGKIPDQTHIHHVETVCLLRGGGWITQGWLWGRETPRVPYEVHPGQRLVFRPGQIHGYTSTSAEPTVALIIFSPPAGPGDDALMTPGPRPEPKAAPSKPAKAPAKAETPAKAAAPAEATKPAPAEAPPKAAK